PQRHFPLAGFGVRHGARHDDAVIVAAMEMHGADEAFGQPQERAVRPGGGIAPDGPDLRAAEVLVGHLIARNAQRLPYRGFLRRRERRGEHGGENGQKPGFRGRRHVLSPEMSFAFDAMALCPRFRVSFKSIGEMMTIGESDFRKLDLNLLVAFQVLVRERSVSRAAERLFLGQPAMSGALARLRDFFQDEILVRTGRGMAPTTKALALAAQLAPVLESLRATLFEQPAFDPATQSRTFHLGMRDWVESWLMPALMVRVQRAAPRVRLAVRASDARLGARMLEDEEMDLGVSV